MAKRRIAVIGAGMAIPPHAQSLLDLADRVEVVGVYSRDPDRRAAIEGARYIITCTRIGGLEAYRHDIEIPLKYGIDQCVGDTICAGGILYGQRNIPVILDFCRDARHESPDWPAGYWPAGDAPPDDAAWDRAIAAFRADRAALEAYIETLPIEKATAPQPSRGRRAPQAGGDPAPGR